MRDGIWKRPWVRVGAIRVLVVAAAATLLLPSQALAHRPVWSDRAVTRIPDSTTSFAFYRDLGSHAGDRHAHAAGAAHGEHDGEVHLYAFSGQIGERFGAGINIPAVLGLERYGVMLLVAGPGLPAVDAAAVPEGVRRALESAPSGAAFTGVLAPSVASRDFFEPFTQTSYWGRQRIDVTLPESGEYALLVWNPDGNAGKYVLDSGTAEVFGPSDLLVFPAWWVRVHLFFGHGPYLSVGLVSLAALMASLAFARSRKRRRSPRVSMGADANVDAVGGVEPRERVLERAA